MARISEQCSAGDPQTPSPGRGRIRNTAKDILDRRGFGIQCALKGTPEEVYHSELEGSDASRKVEDKRNSSKSLREYPPAGKCHSWHHTAAALLKFIQQSYLRKRRKSCVDQMLFYHAEIALIHRESKDSVNSRLRSLDQMWKSARQF